MRLDGKLLARATDALAQRRADDAAALERRRAEVYARVPAVRELDRNIALSVMQAVGQMLSRGGDVEKAVAEIARENLDMQMGRAELLVGAGYPMDWLDEKPRCEKCRDSGYVGSEICSCLMELYEAEKAKELTKLPGAAGQCFETFDLSLYDTKKDPKSGVAPREAMELVLETCRSYARSFGPDSVNLLLIGEPGLGKTHLAASIAKVVSACGCSVVYESASAALGHFESRKFSRDAAEAENADCLARRCMESDLLIIDDLGTEMVTSFSVSALYDLLNTRHMEGRKTVLCTNLKLSELRRRYPASVMSRIEGEFERLSFYGSDIRLLRKNGR